MQAALSPYDIDLDDDNPVNDRHHYLHDIDPDIQLFNELPSLETEYFSESSFNNSLNQYPGSNKSFSIFHANKS